jgi:type VI secretion system protein VasJ
MLEKIRSQRRWQWVAYGKHPAAKDCIKLGQDFPLLNSFTNWIENGYQVLACRSNPAKARCSWRFWAREARKENLVCGVARDSNDSLGRPYPLVIMGTGPLKDWVSQWDLVPLACESVWGQMEYLSTKTFSDLRELVEGVQSIVPPAPEWLELARKREGFEELGSIGLSEPAGGISSLADRMEYSISLAEAPDRDPFELIGLYHSFVRARREAAPSATFMAVPAGRAYVAFFKRPLAPTDFIYLWSITEDSPWKPDKVIST